MADERAGRMGIVKRVGPRAVALETTLLVHGVPREAAPVLAAELDAIVRAEGANPALVGVVGGRPTVGMNATELGAMLAAPKVPKANSANLGVFMHRHEHAATTVSATMELAAGAGVRVFATGGIGGVHKGYGQRLDISADLAALARVPMVVVASGVKSLLDVAATREVLETLGVCVVGYRADEFPAFYLRSAASVAGRAIGVDARFDEAAELAAFARTELARRASAILVCNPIPHEDELDAAAFAGWLEQAEHEAGGAVGRDVTPRVLARLHELSGGATLRANLALVKSNAAVAGRIAAALG
ncbi:MAG: pseudouridine-5'-phosphate glycosidase [Phycisphaerales bacterium]|nr:pseudouridine-5'-phosphate glycosidase [Phycisphaerales bacterium]